ncbi:MAG TPA: polysaccharide deacetylase family protein [Coleofasciculaceae cyanobacterium]
MQLAPLYPILYQILKPSFPGCLWTGARNSRAIALTFDDGPHPQYTPQLLQVLDRYAISASFFWLGVCVERAPTIAREVYQRGHWIGLHGYHHDSFPFLTPDALKQSLEKTQRAICTALAITSPNAQAYPIYLDRIRDVRPPNGLFTPQTLRLLRQWNYRPVMWSVVPEDWERPGVDVVVQRVLHQVQNGSLIVLHDGYYGGQDVAEATAQLIPQLLHQGYQFVTIDQLWQQNQQLVV